MLLKKNYRLRLSKILLILIKLFSIIISTSINNNESLIIFPFKSISLNSLDINEVYYNNKSLINNYNSFFFLMTIILLDYFLP